MFLLGSAYPLGKFGLNASMNPFFFGALRMGFVFFMSDTILQNNNT